MNINYVLLSLLITGSSGAIFHEPPTRRSGEQGTPRPEPVIMNVRLNELYYQLSEFATKKHDIFRKWIAVRNKKNSLTQQAFEKSIDDLKNQKMELILQVENFLNKNTDLAGNDAYKVLSNQLRDYKKEDFK